MSEKTEWVLRVEGMTCAGCARHVTEALRNVPGVVEVAVGSWQTGQAVVVAAPAVREESLLAAVEKAGYHALRQTKREHGAGSADFGAASGEADYDLLIIGGGSAAFAAALKAAELDARVAIIEKGTLGGTCVNIGCVPSKTLIKAAEICYHSAYPAFEGLSACPPPSDWQRVVQQKDELVAALRQGKYVNVAESYRNISVIQGRAVLLGGRRVAVDGKPYRAGKILVATGSLPWAPPIPGLVEAGYLDSTDALSLSELPESMVILGAGAIGLELAQLFARFGVRVMVLEGGRHVARVEEPEIGSALMEYLAQEKVTVCTGVRVERVERVNGGYRIHTTINGAEAVCRGQQLLVATGRRPATGGLGLEEAGVRLGAKGEIVVDEHLRTDNPDVYAAGDCLGEPMYVYVAAYAGGIAAENALKGSGKVYDLSTLPHVIFTDPEVASVGLTQAQAESKGLEVQTAVLELKHVPRALASRNTRGLIKLVAEKASGRLVGAHILAAGAGEVIQEATLAIRFGLRVDDLIETFHPYLTMAEGLKLAALTFRRDVSKLSCCAV